MKRSIFYLLTVALVFWVQAAANYFAGVSGVSGNVILVATIYFGLARGPMSGQLLGFFWGLLIDASTLGLMGQNALLYAAAGFLAGMLRRQLDEDKGWTQVIFSFAASLLYILVHGCSAVYQRHARTHRFLDDARLVPVLGPLAAGGRIGSYGISGQNF
jgi:rod shape-determining protein MreD